MFDHIQSGADVDLFSFPAPLWHEKDGGRYIGTGCMVVTKDLDSDWINVGTYRVMIHDRNHVGLDMIPGKHGAIQYDKHMKAGKPFPVAIVIGCDPLGYLISGIEVPFGMCEYNYIGAILKKPVSVVKGQLTGLPFPGASEIVKTSRAGGSTSTYSPVQRISRRSGPENIVARHAPPGRTSIATV